MPADRGAVVVDVFIGAPIVTRRPRGVRVHVRDFNPEHGPHRACRYCADERPHTHSVSSDHGVKIPAPKGMTR